MNHNQPQVRPDRVALYKRHHQARVCVCVWVAKVQLAEGVGMEIPLVSTCFIATLCVTFRVFAEVERVFVEVRLCYTIFQLFISNIFAKVEHPSTKSQPSKSPFQLDFQIQNHHLPSLEKRKNNKKNSTYILPPKN